MASLALTAATPGSGTATTDPAPAQQMQHMQPMSQTQMQMPDMPQMSHSASSATLPPSVTFPYGFPREGDYRLFIQVKRASGVQTGVFDVHVD
jgi:hypothetical protein